MTGMMLEHEGLEVYQVALDFLVAANAVIEGLPRGRGHLSEQFTPASLSMVLNIAEGAGTYSKPDERRYYLTRRGSATESAELLDVCYRLERLDEKDLKAGKERVTRIVSMGQAGSQLRTALTPRVFPFARLRPALEHRLPHEPNSTGRSRQGAGSIQGLALAQLA